MNDNGNDSSSKCQLGEAVKKRREEGPTATDRLSHLPDLIMYHILSFLDTKSAVQTCVLSRVWRCVWKHVPVLDLNRGSFSNCSSFRRYVDKVLSLRYPFSIRKLTYIDDSPVEEPQVSLFVKVIQYALSHDTQHLVIDLDCFLDVGEGFAFSDLFGAVMNCNTRTLELGLFHIDSGFESSGFGMLTTLKLYRCLLASDRDEDFDPFSKFPSLENLAMISGLYEDDFNEDERILKISGAQLQSLKLHSLSCPKMEIFAPSLKSFSFRHDLDFLKFFKLTVPSIDHADIRFDDNNDFLEDNKEFAAQLFISLFLDLKNATSLMLDCYTVEVLTNISEILEQQPSPFTRLKSLIVEAESLTYTVPCSLVNYFLNGSKSEKLNVEVV